MLGRFVGVGEEQKRLLKYERALKTRSKTPTDILLTFHF